MPEALGEDVGSDPGDRLLEIAEAARSVEERLHEQQRPAIADAIERFAQGRRPGPVGALLHTLSVPAPVAMYSDLQFDSHYRWWRLEWLYWKR